MKIEVLSPHQSNVMQRMVAKDLTATNCNVYIDPGEVAQLNEVKLINCVIQSEGHQIRTNERGEIYSESSYATAIYGRLKADKSDPYKEEGIAVYANGKLVYGIHPDNVENNIEALANGTMVFDWKKLLDYVKQGGEKND